MQCSSRSAAQAMQRRKYLTCAVRLSPEKEPETFIALAAELHASGALKCLGLTPLLLASARTPYADDLRTAFRQRVPTGQLRESFLSTEELAGIFAQTRLNVHPCTYDAYGMTVIEAASQGAPSVVHRVRGCTQTTAQQRCVGMFSDHRSVLLDHIYLRSGLSLQHTLC